MTAECVSVLCQPTRRDHLDNEGVDDRDKPCRDGEFGCASFAGDDASLSVVVARLVRATQYAVALMKGAASAAVHQSDDAAYWALRLRGG